MKKIGTYFLFYCLMIVSIFLSIISSLFVMELLSIREKLFHEFYFSYDLVSVLMAILAIPLFIFFFQLFQDVNYQIIHLIGQWAHSKPLFSHRGITIPRFYEISLQNSKMKNKIKQSKYRYRLFAILQWVIATLVAEGFMGVYWLIVSSLNLQLSGIFYCVPMFLGLFLSFHVWGKLQKKFNLEIAYIENEREFYFKKEN